MTQQIVIFTRYPVPGKVKTRLIPAIGPEGAAMLHQQMTEHVVETARTALGAMGSRITGITVCCDGAPVAKFRPWLGEDLHYLPQSGKDLGIRMHHAFKEAFCRGADAAILIGSDLPDLTSEIIHLAFSGLLDHDIVLGPTTDGGYYLIGMKVPHPGPFNGVDWGTENVLSQTVKIIKRLGLSFVELPVLSDVDRPEDLTRL